MLIFDRFPNRRKAAEFASRTNGGVYFNQDASDIVDPFPSKLKPPIVLVPRAETADGDIDPKKEDEIIAKVRKFRGQFAGT